MPDGSRSIDPREPQDPAFLSKVYRAHSAYVWRVLRHCGVLDDDLDDAVQDTFLVVFRRLPEFQARASLRTWIYAVAVRVASTRRRSRRREASRRERAGAQMHGGSTFDPEAALSRAEAANVVDQLLDELDPAKRMVFVLAEIEGVKVPEISRILGVNPRTVHSRLRLARERFGSALRRLHAREQGQRRVSRLRSRELLRTAVEERPAARRRTVACAVVMVRLEEGESPTLPGWQSLTLSSGVGTWAFPVVVGAVLGAAVMSAAIVIVRPGSEARPSAHVETEVHAKIGEDPKLPSPGDGARGGRTNVAESFGSKRDAAPRPAEDFRRARRAQPPPTRRLEPARPLADPVSTLAEETQLLESARAALRRGDANTSLATVDDHLRRFPRGVFADEARSTRLRALCAAGRRAEAIAYAQRLSLSPDVTRWHDIVEAACR